jgi:16S rRNA (adenine1518-N6/adenine1519-N6)-dimethyltransferase
MSLEEIKQLLLAHKISPNKLLGQNFMVDVTFYPKLSSYAELNTSDVVLDAGAGFGFLTLFLSHKCKELIAVEKDHQVATVLNEKTKDISNVRVVEGDVLRAQLPPFNKLIAIPPYYLSSNLVIWLIEHKLDCAVMILQKEFACRLLAPTGSEEYSWLTVFTQLHMNVTLLDTVAKDKFYPPPEVDSIIIRFKPWDTEPFLVKDDTAFLKMLKWLFTQRNKKIAKAIVPFIKSNYKLNRQEAEKIAFNLPFHDKRAREIMPKDFGAIANALPN